MNLKSIKLNKTLITRLMFLIFCIIFEIFYLKVASTPVIVANKPTTKSQNITVTKKESDKIYEETLKIFKKPKEENKQKEIESEDNNEENQEEENVGEQVHQNNTVNNTVNKTANYTINNYVRRDIPSEYNILETDKFKLYDEAEYVYNQKKKAEEERYEKEENKDKNRYIENLNAITREYNNRLEEIKKLKTYDTGYNECISPYFQSWVDGGNIIRVGNYFAGHNPGVFSYMNKLSVGDTVMVDGITYKCVNSYFPTDKAYTDEEFKYVAKQITGIAIQFCINHRNHLCICLPV